MTRNKSEPDRVRTPEFRLGQVMHNFRQAAGKSQTEVATALGVAPTRVNALERGRVIGPGDAVVAKLAAVLGLSAEQSEFLSRSWQHASP